MKKLWQVYWRCVKWLLVAAAFLLFVLLPLMPVYGWFRPWPEAEARLSKEGLNGVLLTIGGGSSARYAWDRTEKSWRKEVQRTYFVFPESIRSGDLFTYIETSGSNIEGIQSGLIRADGGLLLVCVTWLGAGCFSIWFLRRWRRERAAGRGRLKFKDCNAPTVPGSGFWQGTRQ